MIGLPEVRLQYECGHGSCLSESASAVKLGQKTAQRWLLGLLGRKTVNVGGFFWSMGAGNSSNEVS